MCPPDDDPYFITPDEEAALEAKAEQRELAIRTISNHFERRPDVTIEGEDYDLQALRGAAEFFESIATGSDPAPLAFAQAIRRALPVLEMMAEMDDEGEAPDELDTSAVVYDAWKRLVESMPAARVVNDNQPDNQAVILVLRDPPTLPVGTLLYTSYQGLKDNAVALEVFEAAK